MTYVIFFIAVFFLSYGIAKKLTTRRDSWDALHRTGDQKRKAIVVVDDLFYLAYVWGGRHIPLTYTYVCASGKLYQVHPTAEAILKSADNMIGTTCEVTLLEGRKHVQIIDWKVMQPSQTTLKERTVIVNSNRDAPSGEGIVKAKYTGEFPAILDEQKDFLHGTRQSISLKESAAHDFILNMSGDNWEMIAGKRLRKLTFYLEVNEVRIPVTDQQFKQVRAGDWIRYHANFFSGASEVELLQGST